MTQIFRSKISQVSSVFPLTTTTTILHYIIHQLNGYWSKLVKQYFVHKHLGGKKEKLELIVCSFFF